MGVLYFHSPGASQRVKRALSNPAIHGRSPELAAPRQEGELFPAGVLRHFLPKTTENGLDLLEDGLDVPKDGVDTLVDGQIQ